MRRPKTGTQGRSPRGDLGQSLGFGIKAAKRQRPQAGGQRRCRFLQLQRRFGQAAHTGGDGRTVGGGFVLGEDEAGYFHLIEDVALRG